MIKWDGSANQSPQLHYLRVECRADATAASLPFDENVLELFSWFVISASKRSIRRFVITEKAPTRPFSWLKAATTAFTFKILLRHYAKQTLTPSSLNVPYDNCIADPISRLRVNARLAQCLKCESGSSRFQPGEGPSRGPSRGLLCDYEPSDGPF